MRCEIPNCGSRAFWFIEHQQGAQRWVCADCGDELGSSDEWKTVKSVHDSLSAFIDGP